MKKKGHSKINHRGNDYYLSGIWADYDEFTSADGERILVDEKGKVTHSSLADIEAWNDEKAWSQGK